MLSAIGALPERIRINFSARDRFIKSIGSEQESVGFGRIDHVRRIEVGKIIFEVDAVGLGRPGYAPIVRTFQKVWPPIECVVDGIRVPAIDADESAVAAHHLLPARNTVELLDAVRLTK